MNRVSLRATSTRWGLAPVILAILLPTAVGGCGPDDTDEPTWHPVLEDLEGALLSVWGTAANDVWTVGAADDSGAPTVLHYDGAGWTALDAGVQGSLWWVTGDGALDGNGDVWMAGDAGTIVRYDTSTAAFETMTTPSDAQLFGIWASGPDDAWAVGGDQSTNTGVVWHYDGTEWNVPTDLPDGAADAGMFFKVWGRSADDLWIVGLGGVAMHRSAAGWTTADIPGGRRLFTVHGNAAEALAVGGFQSGTTLREQGERLVDVTVAGMPQLNGVFMSADGSAVGVGIQGSVWNWNGDTWTADDSAPRMSLDYHAVYTDPEGGVWAVGGFIISNPLDRGLLHYFGETAPSSTITRQ